MKVFLKSSAFVFLFALLVTPLFAKTYSVAISQAVTVGSTQIPAGNYKISWEGTGPTVKVTLTRSGAAPVVVNAKLVNQKSGLPDPGVVTANQNGTVVLQQIELKSNVLVFETGDTGERAGQK